MACCGDRRRHRQTVARLPRPRPTRYGASPARRLRSARLVLARPAITQSRQLATGLEARDDLARHRAPSLSPSRPTTLAPRRRRGRLDRRARSLAGSCSRPNAPGEPEPFPSPVVRLRYATYGRSALRRDGVDAALRRFRFGRRPSTATSRRVAAASSSTICAATSRASAGRVDSDTRWRTPPREAHRPAALPREGRRSERQGHLRSPGVLVPTARFMDEGPGCRLLHHGRAVSALERRASSTDPRPAIEGARPRPGLPRRRSPSRPHAHEGRSARVWRSRRAISARIPRRHQSR